MRTEDPYEPGTELRIKGEQGTYKYRYATVSKAGMVLDRCVENEG